MATRKLYALLVGINDYARPLIPNLKYTHVDVENMQRYLETTYQRAFEIVVHSLLDQAATRGNIIRELEQHLGQAQENDVAFFFFAGHGSWAKENPVFEKFDTIDVEQTLVCHDSRTAKKYDLSDKELLVLLQYIGRNNAETIVVLDTSHAVTFASHPNQVTRLFEGIETPRKVEHYLYDTTVAANKFYYYKQLLQHKKITALPNPSYVSFHACEATEYAKENKHGGWFTQALLMVLNNHQKNQTYEQVYEAVRSQLLDFSVKQIPQFEAHHKFDVNRVFITGQASAEQPKRFKVVKESEGILYNVQFGAALGFPIDLERSIFFNLFEDESQTVAIGTGEVQFIGLKDSPIHLSLPTMDYQERYWAELLEVTIAPLLVGFTGAATDLIRLEEGVKSRDLAQIAFVTPIDNCRFNIVWQEAAQVYHLYEQKRSVVLLSFDRKALTNERLLELLITRLEHIRQWQRTIKLANPKSAVLIDDILLTFKTEAAQNVQCVYSEKGVSKTIDLNSANKFPQKEYHQVVVTYEAEEVVEYQVAVRNMSSSQDYYLAYLLISADYGVIPLGFNIPLPTRTSIEQLIDPNYSLLSIGSAQETELTNYLKVIVSKEKLPSIEGFMLAELPLEDSLMDGIKSRMVAPKRVKIFDWDACTLAFHLKKKIT